MAPVTNGYRMNDDFPSIVFLDRDGTVNVDLGYVTRPEQVRLIEGAATAIGDLKRAGLIVVVVSNQSAIGRGLATEEDVEATNQELARQLAAGDKDAVLDMVLFAPDHPDSATQNRKPGNGMLSQVRQRWEIQPDKCWMIGDKISDLGFGRSAGFAQDHCLLVKTGEGEKTWSRMSEGEQGIQLEFGSIVEAVRHIVMNLAPT